MTGVWVVLAVGTVLTVANGIRWWHAHHQPTGLGFVSSQWIAEQRVTQGQHRQ
jgi:hypothetical protein